MIILLFLLSLVPCIHAMQEKLDALKRREFEQYKLPSAVVIEQRLNALDTTILEKVKKVEKIDERLGDQKYSATAVGILVHRAFQHKNIILNKNELTTIVITILKDHPGAVEEFIKDGYTFIHLDDPVQ